MDKKMLQNDRQTSSPIPHAGRGILTAGALALGVLAGAGLLGSQTAVAETVRIGGSGAAMPTIHLLGEALKRSAPQFSLVTVPDLGTGGGLRALARDKIDVAAISRPLTKEETAEGLIAVEYARTPFVLATSKKGAPGLTMAQVADVYSGKLLKWPDGSVIRLVIRPVNDLDTGFLAAFSPAMKDAIAASHVRPGLITSLTDLTTMDDIQRLEGGLGTSALAPMLAEKRPLYALPIDGVAPTVKALSDGTYRHFKPFYLATRGRPSAPARRFFDFLQSTEGRQILVDNGNMLVDTKTSGATPTTGPTASTR